MTSKNKVLLDAFTAYCEAHPNERFWQALRNWTKVPSIYVGDDSHCDDVSLVDTFYWEDQDDMKKPL
jgi:hypothetical protein